MNLDVSFIIIYCSIFQLGCTAQILESRTKKRCQVWLLWLFLKEVKKVERIADPSKLLSASLRDKNPPQHFISHKKECQAIRAEGWLAWAGTGNFGWILVYYYAGLHICITKLQRLEICNSFEMMNFTKMIRESIYHF